MDCRSQLASLAVEELTKGDYLMATKLISTNIRLTPNSHELYFERSICHHKLGDYQASLDDANTAIRLNSTDYSIHYQKGLALIGLSMFSEAVASFKKAIELRAKQDDSKLSDIFKLLRDATNELNTARRRPTAAIQNHQAHSGETVPIQTNQVGAIHSTQQGQIATNNDPVDSTTDRPLIHHSKAGTSSNHQNMAPAMHENLVKINGNNNLVANSHSNQSLTNSGQMFLNNNVNSIGINNRVSSSASHINNKQMVSINVSPDISSINMNDPNNSASSAEQQARAAAQYEWNIRRSERIFLHHTGEPGTSGPQYGIITRHGDPIPRDAMIQQSQRARTNSNSSPLVGNNRSGLKRSLDSGESSQYQQSNKTTRSKDGTSSHADSDVDVDDSYYTPSGALTMNDSLNGHKRVVIAPSSSIPAPSLAPSTSAPKDDSYSSKYKRLRRDRERARRGTSKLCTIKSSDLEELQRSLNSHSSNKRFMRVIAPIDGWLYSGQLSVNVSNNNVAPQYVIKLDGDATGSSYLFEAETILNDVIKEVHVKSVSELRKGARICCYFKRQHKCLTTGVVTSRTFEATKSLVSVKYDKGGLSAVPLEDLRLLPPDYPKCMSNCDPQLLPRNESGAQIIAATTPGVANNNHEIDAADSMNSNEDRKVTIDCKPIAESDLRPMDTNGMASIKNDISRSIIKSDASLAEKSRPTAENTKATLDEAVEIKQDEYFEDVDHARVNDEDDEEDENNDDDEVATIPPTDETIDFITSESTLKQQDENHHDSSTIEDCVERVTMTKDNTLTAETQLNNNNNDTNTSRASSEENNYGVEYSRWMFDGPPERIKRHGRTYRDNYSAIRRGNEVLRVGDSAELMPKDRSVLPFIGKIDGLWATSRGEMRVRVRWYYRLIETEGEPFKLRDGENALFETDHLDENDVRSINKATKILSWTDYCKDNLGHVNKMYDNTPKIFYLAGYYDPVRRIKHLRSDVKEAQ